jgi:hypothetical protein
VNGTALEPDTDKVVDVTVPTALSALTSDSTHRVVTDTQINKWNAASGTVTSVNASGASGSHLSVTGGPITSAGTLTVGLENGYSIPSTTKQSEWDAASGTVTSVNASGASNSHLSVTGGPITSSGTLTVGLENGYSIPSTTKQSEWDAASGTVTSVNASAATNSHLSVTGGPITSAGTLTVGLQSGYSIPTTAKQSEWDAASGTVTSVNASGASGSHITVSGGPVTSSGTLTISLQSGYSIPTTAKQSEWDGKVDPEDIEAFFDGAEYNSTDKKIYFKHGSDVITAATIDASDFIKDGMVSNVEIKEGTGGNIGKQCLVITFNTDAGHSPIEIPLTNIFDPSNYYTKAEIDTQFSTETARTENVYVKKETGKGLSTNDYTDADKDKLDGIASGAQVNVIEGVQRNGTDLTVDANKKVNVIVPILTVKVNGTALEPDANKAVDVTVPTALSALTDDSTHRVVTDTQINKWDAASGTVTSVNASAVTNSHLSVTGGPITSAGTMGIGVASGYSIPSTGDQATWTAKQDALVSGENIKTINGESLLGSGNVETEVTTNKVTEITSASTDTQYPSAKAVYDEISELDLVVAASLNDLNSRIKEALTGVTITGTGNVVTAVTENGKSVVVELGTANMDVDSALDSASTNPVENRAIYEYITNDELAISAALNALNDSKLGDIVTSGSGNVVTNIENVSGETIVTFGEVDATVDSALTSSSTNAVESRAIYKVIWEDEKVISAAFNDLNERKVDNSEIDGIVNNLELEMSDITNEIDGLATSAITGVTTTGSGSVVTSISKTGNTLNVTMGSLEAETYSKAEVNAMIAALTARIEALENGS